MVSVHNLTSGIRAIGHGFDSRMLRICSGVGRIVGLKKSAILLMAKGQVGPSHVQDCIKSGWAESQSKPTAHGSVSIHFK